VLFIDAIHIKIRDGQVANRPFYVALEVTSEGRRDILGLWAGDGAAGGAKYWLHVFAELKNRGVADVLMVVCDGLTGLPDSIAKALKPVYTAPTEAAAKGAVRRVRRRVGRARRLSSGSGTTTGPSSCPSSPSTRDPPCHLQHERNRERERPHPPDVKDRGHSRPSKPGDPIPPRGFRSGERCSPLFEVVEPRSMTMRTR
jgi:hypothetical protein